MRLHRGVGTHQTPAERHIAGPTLHSSRKKHLKDNHRLFNLPSESCWILLIISLPAVSRHTFTITLSAVEMSILPHIIFFHLSFMLSVSYRLMQGSGQPSCVIDSKVIHDLAVEATPSVCVFCGRERGTNRHGLCVSIQYKSSYEKTLLLVILFLGSALAQLSALANGAHWQLPPGTNWLSFSAALWQLIFPNNNSQHHLTEACTTLGEEKQNVHPLSETFLWWNFRVSPDAFLVFAAALAWG